MTDCTKCGEEIPECEECGMDCQGCENIHEMGLCVEEEE